MRILVTGGSGFIGSHVCRYLSDIDHTPVSFDRRLKMAPERQWEYQLGDVRDATAVSESVSRVDGVIHLAAVLGTQETVDNPGPAAETNILGSLNVFQACRQYGRPCVYIAVGNHWMENPYSITKTTAERFAWMFNAEHGTSIRVVRGLNAYGPGQAPAPVRKIIPTFVLAALREMPIPIYGDGTQIMDMIYVADLAQILVRALLFGGDTDGHAYEAGTGRATTVNAIAEAVHAITGYTGVTHLEMRPGEPAASVVIGNPETLRPLFGGRHPEFRPLATGLQDTIDYYRTQLSLGRL